MFKGMESTEAFEGKPVPAAFPLTHSPYNCKHNPPSYNSFFRFRNIPSLGEKKEGKRIEE